MIKYDHEVFEKKNTALRQELVDHASNNTISKPETWISTSDIKFENKFFNEAKEAEKEEKKSPTS